MSYSFNVLASRSFSLQNSDKTSIISPYSEIYSHSRRDTDFYMADLVIYKLWTCEPFFLYLSHRYAKCNRHNRGLRMIQFYSSANMHSSRI